MMDDLPSILHLIKQYACVPKRSLGQNFLLDLDLACRIAELAGDLSGSTILEIGPGIGTLTRALLFKGASQVIAIEKDKKFYPILEKISDRYPNKLHMIWEDALEYNFLHLVKQQPIKIVANLPYNVGTELLVRWLSIEPWRPWYHSMTLMFQKEVAQRIVAIPGNKSYGRLSILAGWRTNSFIAFDVGKECFFPSPRITSSVIHATPIEHPIPSDLKKIEYITKIAFNQRRKMLRTSFKSLGGEKFLEKTGINGTRRAEDLTIEEFVRLANSLTKEEPIL